MKKIVNLFVTLFLLTLTVSAQSYVVNPSQSNLTWNGKKVTGEHYGKVNLKAGNFSIEYN